MDNARAHGPELPQADLPDTASFPFLELPAELRNTIYEYAFAGARISKMSKPIRRLGLLFVCRQIHTEVTLLPYHLCTFVIRSLDDVGYTPSLDSFLQARTEAQRCAIQKLELILSSHMELLIMSEDSWDFDLRRPLFLKDVPNLKMLTINYCPKGRGPCTGSVLSKYLLLKEKFANAAPEFQVKFDIRGSYGRRIHLRGRSL